MRITLAFAKHNWVNYFRLCGPTLGLLAAKPNWSWTGFFNPITRLLLDHYWIDRIDFGQGFAFVSQTHNFSKMQIRFSKMQNQFFKNL